MNSKTFSSMNLLLNDLRRSVAEECDQRIDERRRQGRSDLYNYIVVDGDTPYRAKDHSISVYTKALGRHRESARDEPIFTLGYSDHEKEGDRDSSKKKTLFINDIIFVQHKGRAESWNAVRNRTEKKKRGGNPERMRIARGEDGTRDFFMHDSAREEIIKESVDIIMNAVDRFVEAHDVTEAADDSIDGNGSES